MGNFKIKSIWESKNTGGAVPTDLQNTVNQNEANITNLQQNTATKQYVNEKIQKRVIDVTNTQGNTYTIQPTSGYEIISVMVGRKRTSDGFYFFQYHTNLNFQVFLHSDGRYQIYTQGPVSGFDGNYRIVVVEKKI